MFFICFYVVHADCFLILSFPEGKVGKLTQTSIHVIVLGFSSAVITDEDIRKEFKYKTVSGSSSSAFQTSHPFLCILYHATSTGEILI
jgi:hypothetical protein